MGKTKVQDISNQDLNQADKKDKQQGGKKII